MLCKHTTRHAAQHQNCLDVHHYFPVIYWFWFSEKGLQPLHAPPQMMYVTSGMEFLHPCWYKLPPKRFHMSMGELISYHCISRIDRFTLPNKKTRNSQNRWILEPYTPNILAPRQFNKYTMKLNRTVSVWKWNKLDIYCTSYRCFQDDMHSYNPSPDQDYVPYM